MKKSKKIIAIVLCAIFALSALAGCSSSTDSTTTSSTTSTDDSTTSTSTTTESKVTTDTSAAVAGENQDTQVDRIVVTMASTSVIISPFAANSPGAVGKWELYGKLFFMPYYGASLDECIPWLAKSCTQVDDLTYEVELYDYITDSQGNSITTDDIIWSAQQSLEVGQNVNLGSFVESFEKIDDYSFYIHMATTAPNAIVDVLSSSQLCIVSQEWYENATDDEKNSPATTSAYTVKEYVPGSKVVLEANENYWQTDDTLNAGILPTYRNVKEIEYTSITEASMRVIALQNGEVDAAGISASDLGMFMDLETGEALDGWTVVIPAPTYTYALFPNMSEDSVVGQSLELRKAIFYAIDAEQVMLAAGENEWSAVQLNAFGTSAYAGYQSEWDDTDYWGYNVDTAKECLANAGYSAGEVTITLLSSSALFNDSVRSVIISSLNAIGINVENLAVEQALFSTYKNESEEWDLMIDLKGATTGHISSLYSYNFAAENYSEGQGGVNFWKNDEVYDLVAKILVDASDENILAMEQLLRDNAAIYGLFGGSVIEVAQSGIEELGFSGTNFMFEGSKFADDYVSAGSN
jgi:ABC-type transport system substrate-binding protein